ncbi:DUF86 domain-containing protein [uncultured Thiohalocapsa sp.]|uniref:type VII toxin-antitoxin system HepT family RNase toxin n=1 Tax=uncultured Thiohalocapsa sp. TaxID=768990 RepID=UPI0025E7D97E|nr:DUF86 domain-containing protein [uncultured Thiohalocapsa sp.]
MAKLDRAVVERKLGYLNRYVRDLSQHVLLDDAGRRQAHYAIERLLQLLCETASDIALQFLKAQGDTLPASYREVFAALQRLDMLPEAMARDLIAACGMRNVLTHLYDEIDTDRVIAAVEPAVELYRAFAAWAIERLETGASAGH